MKYLVGIVGALLFAGSVQAQPTSGFGYKNMVTNEALRVGTFCSLTVDDETSYEGLCNVYRRGSTTVVDAGRNKYKIVRDDFSFGKARFYINNQSVGWVSANGSCWEGSRLRYCAK